MILIQDKIFFLHYKIGWTTFFKYFLKQSFYFLEKEKEVFLRLNNENEEDEIDLMIMDVDF